MRCTLNGFFPLIFGRELLRYMKSIHTHTIVLCAERKKHRAHRFMFQFIRAYIDSYTFIVQIEREISLDQTYIKRDKVPFSFVLAAAAFFIYLSLFISIFFLTLQPSQFMRFLVSVVHFSRQKVIILLLFHVQLLQCVSQLFRCALRRAPWTFVYRDFVC